MSSFRIIALRVLRGCDSHIRKALKENVTYFFCNDYDDKYDNERKWIGIIKKKGNEDSVLPSGFFAIPKSPETKKQPESKPIVSISAIVGKNGDGKSSLVELMLRMIYNFGKAYRDQIKGIEAILYYEIDDKLYHIRCSEVKQKEEEAINQLNNDLFYTIVANYSIYAYNSQIFKDEEAKKEAKCWINRGFQDNDSYQQLLGLNPMRTEGNFDVNLERDLCNQRLMALYTDMGNDENTRKINDNKIAEGFAFNLENNSKFETITLFQLFQSTWSSTALSNHSEFLNDYLNSLNTTNTNKSAQNRFDRQKEFWLHYSDVNKYWDKYKELFNLAGQVIKKIFEIHKVKNEDTGLKHYLKVAKEKFAAFIENEDEKEKVLQSLDSVSNLTEKMNMTGLQFQRLVLIIEVCELWSERFPKYNFSDAIKRYKKAFEQSLDQKKPIKVDERCRALLYVIYNTISIFSNTPGLQELFDVKTRMFYLFNDPFYEYHKRLSNCFNDLFIDEKKQQLKKKYNILKLRQTINYLRLSQSKTSILYEQTKGDFGFNHYVKFEELFSFIQKAKIECPEEETIALLPPPIFEGEIIVEENNARYKMSELSSGELQMLHSINTYIYHLRNLDSLQDASGKVKYPYINLILEEVELYFHPEYQRQYVYKMLRQIEQVKLENIKAINIILVTHSPIVLTDIPKNNVLFLKDGKPVYVMQENTFGANIHALLQNGFFLEGVPMGEFANKKINKMFERLHKGDYQSDLFEEIKLVSEPLLKTQLYQRFSLNKLPFDNDQNAEKLYGELLNRIETRYVELLNRIKLLEKK